MKDIYLILEKIGLTQLEARAYLALLELQEARTGVLCKFTKIASSNIYNILDILIKKGLVSYRIQNNIKIFMPAPVEALNELFIEKQKNIEQERKELKQLINNLTKIEVTKDLLSNYKYYENISGIKSMWYEINSIMDKKSTVKIHTAKIEGYKALVGFYNTHHELRIKKQVKEKLIFPTEDIKLAKKRKNRLTEVKFLDLENYAEWGIIKDRFFIQYITGKKPRGFLIQDDVFAKTFEQVFDKLWEIAK